MSRGSKRLLGIATLVVLAVVMVLGTTRPSNPLEKTTSYYAVFDTAQGLGPIDRDVRIAGVKVGTVGEVERRGDDVRVELVLSEGHAIRTDARAAMRPHTLFEGSNFIDLTPGSPSAPRARERATIPRAATTNYVTLDQALRVLRPQIRDRLRDLVVSSADVVKDDGVRGLRRTLAETPRLAKALAPSARALQGPTRTELAGAIRGFAQTVGTVAEREEDLGPFVRGLDRTTAAVTVDDGAALDAALTELEPALTELERTAPVLDGLTGRFDRLAATVNPALPELRTALAGTTPVLRRAIPVVRDGTGLVHDARLIAERLAASAGGLVEMFELLPRPIEQLEQALENLNKRSQHGAELTDLLVGGAFSGFAAAHRSYETKANNPHRPGQIQRATAYIAPDSLTGVASELGASSRGAGGPQLPTCSQVERVSSVAARSLARIGACR